MTSFRFRLIDTAGSEIGVVSHSVADVGIGDTVQLPDGRPAEVVEIYDDEFGREGDVRATLVVDDGSDSPQPSPPRASVRQVPGAHVPVTVRPSWRA